jgi:hypothetical protein
MTALHQQKIRALCFLFPGVICLGEGGVASGARGEGRGGKVIKVIKVNKEIKKVKSYRFGGSIIVSLW